VDVNTIHNVIIEEEEKRNGDDYADSRTVLLYAAELNLVDMAAMLIENGADPRFLSDDGDFALCLAINNSHDQMAKYLFRVVPKDQINRVYYHLCDDHILYLNQLGR
jgi:ankyrin repeat protein